MLNLIFVFRFFDWEQMISLIVKNSYTHTHTTWNSIGFFDQKDIPNLTLFSVYIFLGIIIHLGKIVCHFISATFADFSVNFRCVTADSTGSLA